MLSWFRSQPTCPVPLNEKEWLERRFQWLIDEFGLRFLRSVEQILPTTDYFPSQYEATDEEILALLETVAGYMHVDPGTLRLRYYDESDPHSFLEPSTEEGIFDVCLDIKMLEDPLLLVAVLASEISFVILTGENRVSSEEEDLELLDELLLVYYGLGIIAANSALSASAWSSGLYTYWRIRRYGNLSLDMYGYALALFALMREETQPAWMSFLRPDVKAAFENGVRYITRTGDCSLEIPRYQ